MKGRWQILTVLTLARATMGFQFQSLAAVGPVLVSEAVTSYAALGTLVGIYMLPGAFFAIPGGWLGKRFGDKRVVLAGLAAMTIGGTALALSDSYEVMLAGRVVAGTGAVLLNVLVTKMVTDWFAGHRIVSAMGILISSWPLGIGVALLVMAPLAGFAGLAWAFAAPVALCSIALLLVALVYSSPELDRHPGNDAHPGRSWNLTSRELRGVLLAGCVWCFYNVAFILPLTFGPELLEARGVGLAAAGMIVSLTSWLIIPALPLGGWLTEHIGRPTASMLASFAAIAVILFVIPATSMYLVMFAALGLIFGPAGGLIMALPARVLRPENRALGMGLFFTVYYVGMGVFPAIAGLLRDETGSPAAPFWFAGVMMVAAASALIGFVMVVTRCSDDAPSLRPASSPVGSRQD